MVEDWTDHLFEGDDEPFLFKLFIFILLIPVAICFLPAMLMKEKYSHSVNKFLGSCQIIILIIGAILGIFFKDSKPFTNESTRSTFEIIVLIFLNAYFIVAVIKAATIVWTTKKKE